MAIPPRSPASLHEHRSPVRPRPEEDRCRLVGRAPDLTKSRASRDGTRAISSGLGRKKAIACAAMLPPSLTRCRHLPAPDEVAVRRVALIRHPAQVDGHMGKLEFRGCRRERLDHLRVKSCRLRGGHGALFASLLVETSQNSREQGWEDVESPRASSHAPRQVSGRGVFGRILRLLRFFPRMDDRDLRLCESHPVHPADALDHRIESAEIHDAVWSGSGSGRWSG